MTAAFSTESIRKVFHISIHRSTLGEQTPDRAGNPFLQFHHPDPAFPDRLRLSVPDHAAGDRSQRRAVPTRMAGLGQNAGGWLPPVRDLINLLAPGDRLVYRRNHCLCFDDLGVTWMEGSSVESGVIPFAMLIIMGFFFIVIMLVTAFSMVLSFVLPLAWCQAVAKNSFKGGFEIANYWKVFRANTGGFFIVLALMYGLFGILMMVYYVLYMSIVLWCLIPFILMIGGLLTGLYSLVLWASVYREGMDKQTMPLLKA